MGKNPAFQFYPNDWSRDLEEHPMEIEGAWIRICCKLWWSETRGQMTRSKEQWAKILRTDIETSNRVIEYIKNMQIGNVVTDGNGNITVMSRRMVRDEKDRELNRLRQERFRDKRYSNAPVTDLSRKSNSALLSSSSSSTTKTKKRNIFIVPSILEIFNYCTERKNMVDPEKFFNHYSSNGWMVGKNKMKDWKAAVRTWEANSNGTDQRIGGGAYRESKGKSTKYAHLTTTLGGGSEGEPETKE